jgi:flavodoxin I
MNTKAIVIYYSKTGNTKKVAEAIAEELKAELKSVDEVEVDKLGDYQLLCIGTPVYGGSPCSQIREFLENLPDLEGRKGAGFCTMAIVGAGRTLDFIKSKLEQKKVAFVGDFSCIGQTGIFLGYGPRLWAIGRPNKEDLEKAKSFARKVSLQKSSEHSLEEKR